MPRGRAIGASGPGKSPTSPGPPGNSFQAHCRRESGLENQQLSVDNLARLRTRPSKDKITVTEATKESHSLRRNLMVLDVLPMVRRVSGCFVNRLVSRWRHFPILSTLG